MIAQKKLAENVIDVRKETSEGSKMHSSLFPAALLCLLSLGHSIRATLAFPS